jgi:hypothetical protein
LRIALSRKIEMERFKAELNGYGIGKGFTGHMGSCSNGKRRT